MTEAKSGPKAPVVGRQNGHLLYAVILDSVGWNVLRAHPDKVDWLALRDQGDGMIIATPDPEHFGWIRR